MQIRSNFLMVLAGCALLSPVVVAQQSAKPEQPNANRMMTADSDFMKKAAEGGLAEVEFGKLAESKGTNDHVKQFGQRMVDDHTKANNELKEIASKKGVTLPTSLNSKDQATKDRLSKLSGAEFDRTYMEDMVRDHKTDVAEFRKEANSGSDADLKSFASKTVPTLEEHLKLAEDTLGQVKK